MPRVKLAGYSYKDKDLTKLIREKKYGLGFTNDDMAKELGIGRCKFIDHVSNPCKITIEEFRAMCKALRISKEEVINLIL